MRGIRLALIFSSLLLLCAAASEEMIKYSYFVFTPHCEKSLIQNFNVTDVECLKITVSKLMGYGLVVGGAIVKIPQVIKILIDKSVFGISFTSIILESLANWITIIYSLYRGNPFSIYGENVFILVQNLLIMVLFVLFGRNVPKGTKDPGSKTTNKYFLFVLIFVLGMFLTKNPFSWPEEIINSSMILQIVFFASARLTQIVHIFKCKSTGSLAFITCALVLLGNLGRLFTVLVEISDDLMFLISVILATILNLIIFIQFIVFWNNNPKIEEKHD